MDFSDVEGRILTPFYIFRLNNGRVIHRCREDGSASLFKFRSVPEEAVKVKIDRNRFLIIDLSDL